MQTSRFEARAPLPQLAGEGGPIGRRKTPVFRRPMGPDGVWPAASKPAGLHDHKNEPSTTHSCLPHPIRRASPDTFPTSWRRGRATARYSSEIDFRSRGARRATQMCASRSRFAGSNCVGRSSSVLGRAQRFFIAPEGVAKNGNALAVGVVRLSFGRDHFVAPRQTCRAKRQAVRSLGAFRNWCEFEPRRRADALAF